LSKLSPEVTAEYKDMKAVILQELKLSATTYLEKFNTCDINESLFAMDNNTRKKQ